MPQSAGGQSEALEQLLGEALRAGPGSPQWQQALEAIGALEAGGASPASDAENANEYQMILAARERLESGREYRSVRAGPQFTRRVMEQVDHLAAKKNHRIGSLGKWIMAVGIAAIAVFLMNRYIRVAPLSSTTFHMDRLRDAYFVQERLASDFTRATDEHWKPLGNLPMQNTPWGGLRPNPEGIKSALANPSDGNYLAGGVVLAEPLPADAMVKIEVSLRPGKMRSVIQPQIFISDQPDFSSERAASSHEFTWMIKPDGNSVIVMPSGKFAGQQQPIREGREPVMITLEMNQLAALVECGGSQMYFDGLQLDQARPRYLGVRFVVNSATPVEKLEDLPGLLSVKIWNAK